MIAWVIIWLLLFSSFILLVTMEFVNGSTTARAAACLFLLFIVTFIPIITLNEYHQSVNFVNKYSNFVERAKTMSDYQEYKYLGNAIEYNHHLYLYQSHIKKLGIFAPYCRDIRKLEPIQFRNFDMNNYAWWR